MIARLRRRIREAAYQYGVERYVDVETEDLTYVRVFPWWLRWSLPLERPMLLIVGRRGSGKTLLAVDIAVKRMRSGEAVYANFGITDVVGGFSAGRLHTLMDVTDLTNCTVIIDEANLWCSSRDWQLIPADVRGSWAMSRKDGLSFIFTTQHESRVDLIIRELVDWVLVCERIPLIPKWLPFFRYHRTFLEEINEVRRGTMWKPNTWRARPEILGAYGTKEKIDATMLARLAEHKKAIAQAIKEGKDPQDIGSIGPPRIPPMYRDPDGNWHPLPGHEPSQASNDEETEPVADAS